MDKKEIRYEDFLKEVNPAYHEFVNETHEFFLSNQCAVKFDASKSGYVVFYAHPKTKKVIANYVFRKSGLIIRIYGEHVNEYIDFLNTMPECMIKSIEKSSVCKRLIDPTKCNSKCSMGYEFVLKDTQYQKCRHSSFMFVINNETIPVITNFLAYEVKARAVG